MKILLAVPKLKYLFHLLVSVGFLPLLVPHILALAAPEFFLNLFSAYNPQWQVRFHYTGATTPFIFIAAIMGTASLLRCIDTWKQRNLVGVYLISISLFWNFMHSPSPLYRNFDPRIYRPTPETRKTLRVLSTIPEDASSSAMNNLGAHLSTRRGLWRFPIKFTEADYVVVNPKLPDENFDLSQISPEDFEEKLRVLCKNRTV